MTNWTVDIEVNVFMKDEDTLTTLAKEVPLESLPFRPSIGDVLCFGGGSLPAVVADISIYPDTSRIRVVAKHTWVSSQGSYFSSIADYVSQGYREVFVLTRSQVAFQGD